MPLKAIKLPLTLDVASLQKDLAAVGEADWKSHFNAGYHDGGWSGVSLRGGAGLGDSIYPDPAREHFTETALLARCPNVQSVLAAFECPLLSVRFLRLRAGSVIREHRDHRLAFEDGEVRLHIPIATNPGVEFCLDGERLPMGEGETWYVNVNLPHRVQNLGATDRIHLVIDCKVNDWLAALFAAGEADMAITRSSSHFSTRSGGHPDGLDALRQLVWREPALAAALWGEEDTESFVRLALQTAQARGWRFTDEDLRSAMRKARRTALERWTVQ